jgi:hypothetical protein
LASSSRPGSQHSTQHVQRCQAPKTWMQLAFRSCWWSSVQLQHARQPAQKQHSLQVAAILSPPASSRSTQLAHVQMTREVMGELEMWIKARTTTAQDRSSQAASGHATAASCWGDAVSLLKDVPAAAANGTTGQQLYSAGLTCLRECTLASNLCPLKSASQKHLVDDLKVCMCWQVELICSQ